MTDGGVGCMRLHLVRHGPVAPEGTLLGARSDPEPSQDSCALAARQIVACAPAIVMTSPLKRCRMPAESAAALLQTEAVVLADLAEYDFGEWDGRSTADFGARDRAALDQFYDAPAAHPPPQGEDWNRFRARVANVIGALAKQSADGDACLVTHAGVMRAALIAACGLGQQATWAFRLRPAVRLTLEVGRAPADGSLWGSIEALVPA